MSGCLRTSVGFVRSRVEEKRCRKSVRTRAEKPAKRSRWLERDAWKSRLFCGGGAVLA